MKRFLVGAAAATMMASGAGATTYVRFNLFVSVQSISSDYDYSAPPGSPDPYKRAFYTINDLYQFNTTTDDLAGGTVFFTGPGGFFDRFYLSTSSGFDLSYYQQYLQIRESFGPADYTGPLSNLQAKSGYVDFKDVIFSGHTTNYYGEVVRYFSTEFSDTAFGANNTFTVTSTGFVPEPATWAMMVGGFGLIGAAMRRRGMRNLMI